MYDVIDVVALAEAAATRSETFRRDRGSFAPYTGAAEAYAREHGLVLAGDEASRRLVNTDAAIPRDHEPLEFYSGSPLNDARAMTGALAAVTRPPEDTGREPIVVMKTTRARELFSIEVNERQIAKIRASVSTGGRAPQRSSLPRRARGCW